MRYFLVIGFVWLFSFSCLAQGFEYPYNSKKDRDPMNPLINERGQILILEKKESSDFLLQGIMYSEDGSKAVINNEIYSEGEVVDGHIIKKIGEYKVLLEKEGKEFILKWEG